jgi:hypothetical protein
LVAFYPVHALTMLLNSCALSVLSEYVPLIHYQLSRLTCIKPYLV